jgi:hypothetical protein
MFAAARVKCQAVAAASAPNVAAIGAYAPASSKHPPGIILEVVGTTSPEGAVVRNMPVAVAWFYRKMLLSAFFGSRSSCRIISPGRAR